MLEQLEGYDWEEAFKYADPEWVTGSGREKETAVAFTRDDVVTIYGIEDGCNDDASWEVAGLLKDGRHFFLTAWCDYTGWGCREGGRSYVAETRAQIEEMAMTAEERGRLFPAAECMSQAGEK